jgi:hypothetical protein
MEEEGDPRRAKRRRDRDLCVPHAGDDLLLCESRSVISARRRYRDGSDPTLKAFNDVVLSSRRLLFAV